MQPYPLVKKGFRAIEGTLVYRDYPVGDPASCEYAALRETIRSRGGARPWAFLVGISTWAVSLVGLLVLLPNPIAAVVPLVVLLATFEVVRALHLGVERIGRYLQVFFEETSAQNVPLTAPAWERAAMLFGPTVPGAGGHPFFLPVLVLATCINFLAVVLPGPVIVEWATMAVPHLAFIVWMGYCDRAMRKQRATELSRFREMKASGAPRR